jgi:Icc-related predicted phosphoesterase
MKILYTSDIHAASSHLKSMVSVAEKENADTLIIGGDLIPHYFSPGRQKNVLQSQKDYIETVFLPAISELKIKRDITIYLDLANDDFIGTRPLLAEQNEKLFYLLHLERYPLTNKVDVIGYMCVPPTPFGRKDWEKPDSKQHPYIRGNRITINGVVSSGGTLKDTVLNLETEDTIEKDLSILSEKVRKPFIFVSHCPPYNTPLDMLFNGTHVGSISIRNFIEKWSETGPLIASFHGHIHESPSISGAAQTMIGNCPCANPGQGVGDGAAFQFVLFEIENGLKPSINFL